MEKTEMKINRINGTVVTIPQTEVPVIKEVDVLILGSGPAGVAAAISAGREGMDTLLVESCGNVGGIATEGLMSHWTGGTEGGIMRRS